MKIHTFINSIIIVNVILSNLINASVVFLHNKPNFYELDVKRSNDVHGTNFEQSYSYIVGANGKCASKNSKLEIEIINDDTDDENVGSTSNKKKTNNYNLESKILIYPNHEETFSFIIEINFNWLKQDKKTKIEGFEIVFQVDDSDENSISCVQLVPFKEEFLNSKNEFKFRIKDPSFLQFYVPTHIFYFGHAYIRPLTSCKSDSKSIIINEKKLCAADDLKSEKIEIGIENTEQVDTSSFKPDYCAGHLMDQTCVMKYLKSDTYFIIMHPATDQFESIISDLDFYTLTPEQQKLKQEADLNSKSVIKVGSYEYPVNISEGEFVHHIESLNRQKLPNGLIIKLVKYKNDVVHYVGILKNPTQTNPCSNKNNNLHCACNGKCNPCFYADGKIDSNNFYLGVNYDKDPLHYKSASCYRDEFFRPYFNLDKIDMATFFQNQNLSLIKKTDRLINNKKEEVLTPSRENLPRVCLNIKYGPSSNIFDLNIIFNDYYKTGMSTLFNGTKYKFKLYSYTIKGGFSYYTEFFEKRKLCNIDAQLLLEERNLIDLTDLIQIENLKCGAYLIEILPVQKSKLCPPNMCVVESPMKNQFQCLPCSKLIVHFVLENGMLTDHPDITVEKIENNKQQNNPTSYSKRYSLRKLKINVVKSFNLNQGDYKCSIDNVLLSSYVNENFNMSKTSTKIKFSIKEISKFDKYEIYSGTAAIDSNLSVLLLPYIKILDYSSENYDIYFVMKITITVFICFTIIPLLLFISFCLINRPMWDIKKQVVFYLSIDIEPKMQNELGGLIDKYILRLKKYFNKMAFYKIDYNSSIKMRNDIIEKCDLIFYVCATSDEINKLNQQYPIFGINSFQHDYNKIHFLKSFENKCFNISFNDSIKDTLDQMYESRQNSDKENDSSTKTLYSKMTPVSVISPKGSSLSRTIVLPLNRSNCLKLPEYNYQFLSLISQKTNFDLVNEIKKYDGRNRKRSNKLIFYLNELYFNYCNKRLKRSLDDVSKRYLRSHKELLTLSQSIDHDKNILPLSIIEEFENDLEESQDLDSIRTFDSSSTSSFSKNSSSNNSTN